MIISKSWQLATVLFTISVNAQDPSSSPSPVTPGSPLCKQGWTLFSGMCYFVGNDSTSDLRTWHDAESTCRSMNSHLTSINSEEEKAFLRYLIKNKTALYYWIGLNDIGTENNYKWSDGTAYGIYLDWAYHQPDDYKGQEDCMELLKSNGKWNDNHCSVRRSYICKSYNESYDPPVTPDPPRPKTDGYCAPGWIVRGQWCYEFHTDPNDYRTWQDAKEACEEGHNSSDFGQLVSISDELEEAFITINVKGAKRPLWIGMNNHLNYYRYLWTDGSTLKYVNWNTNEPRIYSGHNLCVEVVPYRWAAGRWNSVFCHNKNGYICKTAASRTPITATPAYKPTTGAPPSFVCPQDYKAYEESCYKFVKTPKTFYDARKTCNDDKARLISVNSQFDQAYLVYLLERFIGNVWIGLLHAPYSTFKFTDNSSPIYTYWGSGQPNRQLGQRSCTQANITGSNLGRWDDVDCSNKNPFVCQIYNGEPKITIPVNSTCPSGWRHYDKFCYKHFEEKKNWAKAQYNCSVLGSDLLSIHDGQEQDFLIYYYQDRHPFLIWTGLNDRNREQGYKWIDNTGLTYINWGIRQPDDHNGRENCVTMNSRTGRWHDYPCNFEFSFMCKHKLECSSVLPINPSEIAVTESSNASFGANQAIIKDSNNRAWCTNNTSGNAKIRVDFTHLVQVTKISIQGRSTPTPHFVKSFRIEYSQDGYWQTFTYSGYETIIPGNVDGKNVITKKLERPIKLDSISVTPVAWQGQEICMKIRLHGCDYVCQSNLINPLGRLTEDFITAKSAKYPTNEPKQASELGNAWCAKNNDKEQWVQVNFGSENLISKIRTFGDRKDSYVTSYKIQLSGDGNNWIDYKQHDTVRVFKGNSDAVHPMVHTLSNSIEASYIRILPLTWNKNICLRFMLLGCQTDCDKPLLQGNTNIKFSSSDQNSHPEDAVFKSGKSWCTSKSPLKDQYLQVDFGDGIRIKKIATQGSPLANGKARQVSKFTLKFMRASIWKNYLTEDEKQIKIFAAVNKENPSKPMISVLNRKDLVTTKLRIIPLDFNRTEICMRVEIYGCLAGAKIIPTTESTTENIVNVSVRFTTMEWDDRMSDKNSDEFAKASDKIENAVRSVYKDSEAFREVKVKKLSKGSVVAILKLVFNPEFSENDTEIQPLKDAVKNGEVGSLEVDKESFKIIELHHQARAVDKKGGLSGGAVAAVVITVLLLVCLAIAGGLLFYRRRQRNQSLSPHCFENPILYTKHEEMDDSTIYM